MLIELGCSCITGIVDQTGHQLLVDSVNTLYTWQDTTHIFHKPTLEYSTWCHFTNKIWKQTHSVVQLVLFTKIENVQYVTSKKRMILWITHDTYRTICDLWSVTMICDRDHDFCFTPASKDPWQCGIVRIHIWIFIYILLFEEQFVLKTFL